MIATNLTSVSGASIRKKLLKTAYTELKNVASILIQKVAINVSATFKSAKASRAETPSRKNVVLSALYIKYITNIMNYLRIRQKIIDDYRL